MKIIQVIIVIVMILSLDKVYSQGEKEIPKGQYPFEKYKALKYKSYYNWKTTDSTKSEKRVQSSITIPGFYDNGDLMTIQLTSFTDHWWNNSIIQIFRNNTLIQKIDEDMSFVPIGIDTLRIADINGDGLMDIKLISAYMGNGTASLNVRVIYLFQRPNHNFIKISFNDKMNNNRPERDFDGDGNYEIITMNLLGYENHSYWLFNLFNFKNDELVCTNTKYNYPIMIQYLYRDNYEITNKISREKMKGFSLTLPDDYNKK